jgi:hypothetical protein
LATGEQGEFTGLAGGGARLEFIGGGADFIDTLQDKTGRLRRSQ